MKFALVLLAVCAVAVHGFSLSMTTSAPNNAATTVGNNNNNNSRRAFLAKTAAAVSVGAGLLNPGKAMATPEIYQTSSGIKYAVLKMPTEPKKATAPLPGDIVAIDYTGYLSNGKIFDATHAEGSGTSLLFKLGSDAVIKGLNDMVSNMVVGQKVQAIIPANLAFGDKGLCIESGECLIAPGATLVYDVYLKRSSIPPP